jgi:hypothetical protein
VGDEVGEVVRTVLESFRCEVIEETVLRERGGTRCCEA